MSPTLAFILALLATPCGLKVDLQIDKDDVKRMREREEFLHQEMTRLLQEINENNSMMESLFLSAWDLRWLPWVTEAVLLTVAFWLVRRWKYGSANHREQERFSSEEQVHRVKFNGEKKISSEEKTSSKKISSEEVNGKEIVTSKEICSQEMIGSEEKISSQEKQGPHSVKALKELVDELLAVCRVLSRRNFMPALYPATGTYTSSEARSIQNRTVYRLLVILRPPPGHFFCPDSMEQPPAGRIRVALECLCSGEQLLGQKCFLHAAGGQLPRDQDCYLLDTLCTGSCLNVEKVAHWVQMLVASAWLLLPHSRHCQLTVLPSKKPCIFLLSSTSGLQSRIEMVFAVQQGSSGFYLSLE